MPGLEQRIHQLVNAMPSLSPTVMKVNELANDINSSARDLVKVISMDPVLTAKVLKLINSSYFGLPNEITNLNRAVILLGINTVKNLALSSAVVGAVQGRKGAEGIDTTEIWRHSLGVAVVAKILAREAGCAKQTLEEFFIAGLLHDIGTILVMQYLPDAHREILQKMDAEGLDALEAEDAVLEMSHNRIGELIAEKWRLNANLVASIRDHHRPDRVTDQHRQVVHIVHGADGICQKAGVQFRGDETVGIHSEELWQVVGVSEERALEVTAVLVAEIEKATVFLKAGAG